MSPPASGAYQSRLLKFVSRQTRRWTEQGARTLRHLKVAAMWAAQVLVYPVYAVIQATRLVGRQLHQVVATALPRLSQENSQKQPPPATDRSLERVMPIAQQMAQQFLREHGKDLMGHESFVLTGNSWEIADCEVWEPQSSLPSEIAREITGGIARGIAKEIVIQGIATRLETRSLVLVTPENLLLDILNPEQQWQLRQWIIWEVADYWRDVRSTLSSAKRSSKFLPLPADRPHLLPPVRIFWQLVRWMQTSPLALALDLFQESALVKYDEPEDLAQFGEATLLPTGATFWLTMADLFESRRLGSVQSWNLPVAAVTTTGAISPTPIHGALSAAPDSARLVLASSQAIGQSGSPTSRSSPFGLAALLKAGRHFRLLPLQAKLTSPTTPAAIAPALAAPTAMPEARSTSSLPVTPNRIEADWIEAEVVPVGYVKHPLERVLEWVDRLMFWLEEATIATGRWLKQHW